MSAFTPDSPLVQAVITLLRQNPEGLAIPEIRRNLLRGGWPGVQERDLEQIVRLDLFRRQPGGKIILREMEPPHHEPEPDSADRPEQPYAGQPATLRALPSLDSYLLFDVETNGLDPQTADFFQLSAVKVLHGQPVACFDEYVRVDLTTLSRALRVKLHFDELNLETRIQQAGTQSEILERFCAFAGDLPLIAHNGTFDLAFLHKHRPDLPNGMIDSMELFVLVWPVARSHSIEPLATARGLIEHGARWPEVLALDETLGISASLGTTPQNLFHSAIFDCLVLHLLLQDALENLRALPASLKNVFRQLSPALGDLVSAPPLSATAPDSLLDLLPLVPWAEELPTFTIPPAAPSFDVPYVHTVYDQLLEKLNFPPRFAQREMIAQVTDHLAQGTQTMIEAPTGTGKTLAYLIPALAYSQATGQQTLVSTSTKALQDQLLNDLQVRLQPHLPFAFQFALLKGQNNYLCLGKLWDAYQEIFLSADSARISFEEKYALLYLLQYAGASKEGDLQNTSYWLESRFPILVYLKAQLASEGETCGKHCAYFSYCFHPRALAFGKQAHLLVVNHALLLTKAWDENTRFNLILDEAHNLEDAATNAFTVEASRELIEHLLKRLYRPGEERGALIRARRWADSGPVGRALGSVRRLRARLREFGGYLREFLQKQGVALHPKYGASWRMRANPRKAHYFHWRHVQQPLDELLRELGELSQATGAISEQLRDLVDPRAQALRRELDAIRARLFRSEEPGQRDYLQELPQVNFDPLVMVHWIELGLKGEPDGETIPPEKITWAFKRAPVRVAPQLETGIYQLTQALVLTSATLTLAEGGFNYFLDRLGLEARIPDAHLFQLPKEFNYAEQVMLAMPGYFKSSARYDQIARFQEEMAQELACLFSFTEGRGLVLHTARARMEHVATHLEKTLTHLPVYWQKERASARQLKEEFETREESILLGLRSFWEGVDVPGPSLSYLAIEKLPFPVPTDPIIAARMEQIQSEGGNQWMNYLIPLATLHFKQGFGRLMRKATDRGVVLFLDKRLRGDTFYREAVLGSLPGYKRTDDMIEAEESRVTLYTALAEHMHSLFPNLVDRLDLIPCIREEIIPDLERILREYQLPRCMAEEQYPDYRPNLLRAVHELNPSVVDFRPEQDDAMRAILACQDTLVVLPTGSGKSLTFQLPALLRDGVTLVFSPLIALMRDQVERLREKGLTLVDYIVSGQSGAHRDDVYRRMARGELRLVYIAPERIRDPALAEALRRTNVIQIVVDEAHCVHMWGHSFRPDFLNIPDLFATLSGAGGQRPPIVALTATATQETREGIANALSLQAPRLVTKSVDRPELKFIVYNQRSAPERIASKPDKFRVLLKILLAVRRSDETAIIYTSTVKDAEYLSRKLNLHGFAVRHYHGKMLAQEREEVQEMFREGIIKIIIATKAFGMGIDKADVRYVIHYNVPGDLESYYQEAGRGGRDGKPAYCVLLYHRSDVPTQQFFIQNAFPDNQELNSLAHALRARANGQPQILVSPDDLAEEAGIEDERLGVALHMLERLEFIKRSFNFTVMANILLNRSPAWLMERLSLAKAAFLQTTLAHTDLSDKRGITLDLLATSQVIGSTPLELDQLFTELSAQGWAVYRPWERGFILDLKPKLLEGSQVQLGSEDIRRLQTSMERNLKRMVQFAEGLRKGDCRRATALQHFGETLENRPTPCCDLCHPEMPVPWRNVSAEEVASVPTEISPDYLALRAVEWNQNRQTSGYRPYTLATLTHILTGNAYAAARYEADPIKKRERIKRLEKSPYYAALQGLKGGEKVVQSIFERLNQEAYMFLETITFAASSGEVSYNAPMLTDKGKEKVMSGQYF